MQNVNVIAEVEDFNQENLQENVKGWIIEEIGFGKVMQPLRLSSWRNERTRSISYYDFCWKRRNPKTYRFCH